MNDIFFLPLKFADKLYNFQVTRQTWGGSYRYAVRVEDLGFLFEPEESGKFRSTIVPGQPLKNVDIGLLEVIGKEFERLTANNLYK